MNKIIVSLIISSAFLIVVGCGSGESNPITKVKNTMKQVSETVDVVKTVSNSQSTIMESMDRMEELKNTTPSSKEELKIWLPEQMDGFKRKSYSAGDQGMGSISSISASYSDADDENKTFDLSVIDGAGEAGGVFALVYLAQFNRDFEEEHSDGFSKSIEKGDKKAIVSQDDRYKTAELEYLEGQRYYVKISGNNLNVDELWEIASRLKTSSLPGL